MFLFLYKDVDLLSSKNVNKKNKFYFKKSLSEISKRNKTKKV